MGNDPKVMDNIGNIKKSAFYLRLSFCRRRAKIMPETQKLARHTDGLRQFEFLPGGTGMTFAERTKPFKVRSFHKRFAVNLWCSV